MAYVYQFDIAAIIMDVMLILIFHLRNRHNSTANRIFRCISLSILMASIADLISCFTITNPEAYPLEFNYVVSLSYLFFYNICAVLFLGYIDSKGKIPKFRYAVRHTSYGLFLFYTIAIFSSPWTHFVAYFDENLVYRHGPVFYFMFFIPFVLFAWEVYIFICARSNFNKYQVLSSTLLIVGMAISVGITIILPEMLIGQFIVSLVGFYIYITFENPAYYCYRDSQCGNKLALSETLSQISIRRRTIIAVVFKLEEYSIFKGYYSESDLDKILVKVADVFYQNFRERAFYLNDESFVVFTTNARLTIEKAENAFKDPIITPNLKQKISLSYNILNARVKDAEDVELVLENMTTYVDDSNFYVVLKELKDEIEKSQKLGAAIKRAIASESFEVYYQPIYNLNKKRFESAEALIRLFDDEMGFVNPEELIVFAEHNGLINDVGLIVLKKVCKFIVSGGLERYGIRYIEINVSPIQCMTPGMASQFLKVLNDYGVRPEQLNIELTETAEASNDSMFFANIDFLHKQGISFSIDDYGSGFASASYLIKFPIQIVKIDKMILWDAMKDYTAMIVFMSTVKMIQDLGIEIVVEGGETKEMIDLLREEKCDFCQGYYFSKPLPEDEFIEFIKKQKS